MQKYLITSILTHIRNLTHAHKKISFKEILYSFVQQELKNKIKIYT